MVRGDGALFRPARADPVRHQPPHPLASHQSRESEGPRSALRRPHRSLVRGQGRQSKRRQRVGRSAAADVYAVSPARPHPRQPRRRLADVHVFVRGRNAERLASGASRQPGGRRRRAGHDRDDRHLARGKDHARLRRHVEAGAGLGMEAGGRLRAHELQREDRHSARPCRPQRLQPPHVGGYRRAARRGKLAARSPLAGAVSAAWPGAEGHGSRRHGQGPRRFRPRRPARGRGWLRYSRGAFRPWLSAVHLPHALSQQARGRVWRQPRESHALPARGLRCGARSMAADKADQRAHLGDRLGSRRVRWCRRSRGVPPLEGAWLRHRRCLGRPDHRRCQAGLRPALPDPLCRPHSP